MANGRRDEDRKRRRKVVAHCEERFQHFQHQTGEGLSQGLGRAVADSTLHPALPRPTTQPPPARPAHRATATPRQNGANGAERIDRDRIDIATRPGLRRCGGEGAEGAEGGEGRRGARRGKVAFLRPPGRVASRASSPSLGSLGSGVARGGPEGWTPSLGPAAPEPCSHVSRGVNKRQIQMEREASTASTASTAKTTLMQQS